LEEEPAIVPSEFVPSANGNLRSNEDKLTNPDANEDRKSVPLGGGGGIIVCSACVKRVYPNPYHLGTARHIPQSFPKILNRLYPFALAEATMEFQSSNSQRRVSLGPLPATKWAITCVSTLAVGPEARNVNAIKFVGGESGVGEQGENGK